MSKISAARAQRVPESSGNEKEAGAHLWSWKSFHDKRVCRATLQGEAHGLLSGAEAGDRLTAIICDLKGCLPDMRNWQQVCSENMRHIWLSDCESLVSHLKNPKNERLENVRLPIDIQSGYLQKLTCAHHLAFFADRSNQALCQNTKQ